MNPNAVVSTVIRFEPPLEHPPAQMLRGREALWVELKQGRRARLEPEDPRSVGFAQVLDGLSRQRRPVYLEIDPETSAITMLLIPYVTQVLSVQPIHEGLGVELARSHALHVLRRSEPEDFAELEEQMRGAMDAGTTVVVTEDEAHNIIDIRSLEPGPGGPSLPKAEIPPPNDSIRDLLHWILRWLRRWFQCASPTKAQQVFNAMNTRTCDLLTAVPCIPFLYPDDGGFARAHEMCRLMFEMGLEPGKVWIKGDLHVTTKDNPYGEVFWGWHVAPTLCVGGPGPFQTQDMVIDPSLFTTPVTKAEWKLRLGDPGATMIDSDASPYLHTLVWSSNGTDPDYVDTDIDLAYFRLKLLNRSVQWGFPPYANCP